MVFSRGAVERIIASGITCPRDDYPDDMFLGSTAKALNIDIVSSSLFHQVSIVLSICLLLLGNQKHRHSHLIILQLYWPDKLLFHFIDIVNKILR